MNVCACIHARICVWCAGSMVTTLEWNDEANILAALQDGKFSVWYHPAVVYTDPDLLPKTQLQKEGRCVVVRPHLLTGVSRAVWGYAVVQDVLI